MTEPPARASLSRSTVPRSPRSVGIVHLGLGAFHRAHQAAWTQDVDAEGEWGIAAFTGRSPEAARRLRAQDGLFTLVTRAPDSDSLRIIDSLTCVHDGSDQEAIAHMIAHPGVRIVTLTLTEAAYGPPGGDGPGALDRLTAGLLQRYRADGGPVSLVPCDNLPGNGGVLRASLLERAETLGPGFTSWLADEVGFVSTVVDRITPRSTPELSETVARATGLVDLSPVVTEPFREWVLEDAFRTTRPRWEDAGAVVVADPAPYERRKLWLLNGAHVLLATRGLLSGVSTIAEAMEDPDCRGAVERYWSDAGEVLAASAPGIDLAIDDYVEQLRLRFGNPRISHAVTQIAEDASIKIAARVVPILAAGRASGRRLPGVCSTLSAWVASRVAGLTPPDRGLHPSVGASGPVRERARALLESVSPEISADSGTVQEIAADAAELVRASERNRASERKRTRGFIA